MEIYYVTGNKGKVDLMNSIYKDKGVTVIQENMETPEIQSTDCAKVAAFSSEYAANLLGKPVVKNDSGFCIEALDNFPGALAKYAEDTIKAKRYIKMLEGEENRACYFIEALAYCEPKKEPVVFKSITYGTIANEVREGRGYDYDKIFIPKGDTRCFSEMTYEEQLAAFDNKAYIELLKYLIDKQN